MPIASLPSQYGIGTLGKAAHDFVDFLEEAGQHYWQVLPLGPTSYGDSPYQSFSAFAGNPYFIDLDMLIDEGLLKKHEVSAYDWGNSPTTIDYTQIFENRFTALRKAFARSKHIQSVEYEVFLQKHNLWLDDYASYMLLKEYFGWKSWQEWPDEYRLRDLGLLAKTVQDNPEDFDFWRFCQFKFYAQWAALKLHAQKANVLIIGDIPIYVALDSADVWANPHLFDLDANLRPNNVAGVPPDYFSATGQLWGNPLYLWEHMAKNNFEWWRSRIHFTALLYDIIRIDHFIGILRYYSIPANADSAINGKYLPGPGYALLAAINAAKGKTQIIAEDLGVLTYDVVKMRKRAGYPGMKVLQFAFNSGPKNDYLPTHYEKNAVVYGGTHDNETLAGYFACEKRKILRFAKEYLGIKHSKQLVGAVIRAGYASCANTVLFQLQDLLELGAEARMNTPSTLGGNWQWRLLPDQLSAKLAKQLLQMVITYDRGSAKK